MTAEDLHGAGSMAVLLQDALKPNLLQTIEGQPVLVHTGPFGNIATGNSSVVADRIGIHMGDYLITEAGFGADIGAEKFFDVKCRVSGLQPDAAVLVTTVRAMKAHSGNHDIRPGKPLPDALLAENPDEVIAGARQPDEAPREPAQVRRLPRGGDQRVPDRPRQRARRDPQAGRVGRRARGRVHPLRRRRRRGGGPGPGGRGGGGRDATTSPTCTTWTSRWCPRSRRIATELYGADGVERLRPPRRPRSTATRSWATAGSPWCIAKTHLSITSDPTLLGAPTGWGRLPVREVRLAAGAGYVYPICGDVRTMPGLSGQPAAERIDLDEDGQIVGLS